MKSKHYRANLVSSDTSDAYYSSFVIQTSLSFIVTENFAKSDIGNGHYGVMNLNTWNKTVIEYKPELKERH